MTSTRTRVLLAITVYNGRAFVPRCIVSAMGLETHNADVDVLVLDDCSPEPGFSEFIEGVCRENGAHYYRSPRNLGIVRNVNLGMLAAVEKGYDHVIIANSDVIFSRRTVDMLLAAAASGANIGSVTAWSNNVSIYSFENQNPDEFLSTQGVVDWLANSLDANFQGTAIDIPAGISFAMLIPTPVIRDVGLMDPVYGRGYCEETDWSLRSLSRGYRITLAPAAFVYHQGRGSTLAAGMVSGGHSTVPANEAIIDHRYPLFREQVEAFQRSGILRILDSSARTIVLQQAARQFGFDVHFAPNPGGGSGAETARVDCLVATNGKSVRMQVKGFEMTIPVLEGTAVDRVRSFLLDERIDPSTLPATATRIPQPFTPHARPSYPTHV
jgi:GT2 family glycosyltransferase